MKRVTECFQLPSDSFKGFGWSNSGSGGVEGHHVALRWTWRKGVGNGITCLCLTLVVTTLRSEGNLNHTWNVWSESVKEASAFLKRCFAEIKILSEQLMMRNTHQRLAPLLFFFGGNKTSYLCRQVFITFFFVYWLWLLLNKYCVLLGSASCLAAFYDTTAPQCLWGLANRKKLLCLLMLFLICIHVGCINAARWLRTEAFQAHSALAVDQNESEVYKYVFQTDSLEATKTYYTKQGETVVRRQDHIINILNVYFVS